MAVSLTSEQKALLSEQTWLVATASKDGKPNVAAKGMKMIIDDSTLAYAELAEGVTYKNIVANPVVTVAAFDQEKKLEIRCSGKAEVLNSGNLYDGMATKAQSRGFPKPKAVIKINIADIRWMKP
jgi:predicted pyridoxine 5'-phosphate oxidase superfamily flavin-nucleotide-binding protein